MLFLSRIILLLFIQLKESNNVFACDCVSCLFVCLVSKISYKPQDGFQQNSQTVVIVLACLRGRNKTKGMFYLAKPKNKQTIKSSKGENWEASL